jgi:uncharacterized RDD family membrane protein YckC
MAEQPPSRAGTDRPPAPQQPAPDSPGSRNGQRPAGGTPLASRIIGTGARGARAVAGATGVDHALDAAVEEAIVRAMESPAVERALIRLAEEGRLQEALERAIAEADVEDTVRRALETDVSDRVWEQILASDKVQMLVERIAEAPEVRAAIAQQGFGLIADIGRQVSRLTEALDDVAERVAHTVFRRGDHDAETNQAGLVTRLTGFAIDAALVGAVLSLGAGLFASIIPFAFGDVNGLSTLAAVLLAIAAFSTAGLIFVTFWSLVGQTPGMRFLGIRIVVAGTGSSEIGLRRALERWLMIPVAALPLGLGFLAILVSSDRRGWHDVVAGTEVIYDETSAPWSTAPREWARGKGRKRAAAEPPETQPGAVEPGPKPRPR